MYTIHRSIDVGFAHHVRGHRGKCINLHGHTWKFEAAFQAKELDAEGFVVDFARVRDEVLLPVHDLLDHGLAIGEDTVRDVAEDLTRLGAKLVASREAIHGTAAPGVPDLELDVGGARCRSLGGMKVVVFPFNPTSERLARWLYELSIARLGDQRVTVPWTRVYESLHPIQSVAEYRPA